MYPDIRFHHLLKLNLFPFIFPISPINHSSSTYILNSLFKLFFFSSIRLINSSKPLSIFFIWISLSFSTSLILDLRNCKLSSFTCWIWLRLLSTWTKSDFKYTTIYSKNENQNTHLLLLIGWVHGHYGHGIYIESIQFVNISYRRIQSL
jgi:hypothetical protein